MEFKYVFYIKTLCLTAFYTPLNPIVIPITFFGFILNYWVDKYLIFRRHKDPEQLSPHINKVLSNYLDSVPLCLALGGIVFKYFLMNQLY